MGNIAATATVDEGAHGGAGPLIFILIITDVIQIDLGCVLEMCPSAYVAEITVGGIQTKIP